MTRKWHPINDPKHSVSSVPLDRLDWTNWWQDGPSPFCATIYIHVPHLPDDEMGDTVHRVYYRRKGRVRIGMKDGVLCWIVEPKEATP